MSTPSDDDEASRIPPRPPLPPRAGDDSPACAGDSPQARTGDNLQAQFRAKKAELETHVSHARDQLDQANERIKERTGRDLVVAIGVGLLIGGVILASLLFAKWSFVVIGLAIILLAVWELVLALRSGGRKVDLWPQLVLGALLQVDDVDPAALGEDEALHLRVPPTGLVSEVNAAVEQLADGDDGHGRTPCWLRLCCRSGDRRSWCPARTPLSYERPVECSPR